MPSKLLPLLALLFSVKILAYEFPSEIIDYIDDTKIVAFIKEGDIDAASTWSPLEASPPLTMYGALENINEYMASDTELAKASLVGIELKQIPHHKRYWYYLVKMRTTHNDTPEHRYYIVLMNGKIIPAIREPGSIK